MCENMTCKQELFISFDGFVKFVGSRYRSTLSTSTASITMAVLSTSKKTFCSLTTLNFATTTFL